VVTPALYEVDISHVRAEPVRHEVRHRSVLWYVDLDELPDHGVLGRFLARDHAGKPGDTLRANVESYLAEQGIEAPDGRITMLTQARSFGYVFNPLTLYWCHDRAGELRCVVAEVHNTYGQRHRYLLRTDDAGRADVAKEFYVSPFYPVDGSYRMSLPEPGERLALTITLHRSGQRPFVASVRGVRRAATRRAVLAAALRHPVAPLVGRALITRHGVALWRKGLAVQPRPPHPSAKESAMATTAARIESLVRDVAGVELPVRVRAWDGSEAGPLAGPVLVLRSRRALRRLLWAPGELGLARAYVSGDIDVEGDLADGFRQAWALAGNRPRRSLRISATDRARAALAVARLGALGPPPTPPASEAQLSGRLHSKRRDRAAIAHHYDLSNEFYELLLDDTMAYSSGYFADPQDSLATAQRAKLDLICRKLQLEPGARLLDIGCGWGSLILHAAENYGVHATGITLSAQQRDLIAKRIADRGLADLVEVRLQDYRELAGTAAGFDAVSSIEMGEHVGEDQYPTYAGVLHGALRPGGRLLLQQMSRRHDAAPGGGAFIESYIAPDMHMRPMSQTLAHLETAGFELLGVEAMRTHYVHTVRRWLETFEANWAEFVRLQGEEVARVWRLYLVGGALAFEEARMGVDQFLAVRP
jgi:cyclopropane fatty-acyl-phospholipid synthase-like methyltransferase/DUF1365 family protein